MASVEQVFIAGNQDIRRTFQGGGRDPLIVRIPLGPLCRCDGCNHFRVLTDESNSLCNLALWHSKFVLKHSFEFRENGLADQKLVFSEYDLEYVLTKAAGGEGGYQNIGIEQYSHG